jgi:hypothetical protein
LAIGQVEVRAGRVTAVAANILARGRRPPFNTYAPGPCGNPRRPPRPRRRPTLAAWRPWVAGRPLVAQNVGTERKFLRRAAPLHEFDGIRHLESRAGRPIRRPPAGGRLLGRRPSTRLRELCPGRAWHDALFDAFASALVLEHCLALPGWEDVGLEALAALR